MHASIVIRIRYDEKGFSAGYRYSTGIGLKVGPRLHELTSRGQRESGGEIHAT